MGCFLVGVIISFSGCTFFMAAHFSSWGGALGGGVVVYCSAWTVLRLSSWGSARSWWGICSAWPSSGCFLASSIWWWVPKLLAVIIGLRVGVTIGFGTYLATGHVIVWHCLVCRVLLKLGAWLLWCSARLWMQLGLFFGSAWLSSAWSPPARSSVLCGGCVGGLMCVCSAWSLVLSGYPVLLSFTIGLRVGVITGFGTYLATGHVIVWHCLMCRVLLRLVSWLH